MSNLPSSLLASLQALPEAGLRELVRELLTRMRYQNVTIVHGSQELGRDLVFFERDNLGRHIWRGAQVKAGRMTGRVGEKNFVRLAVQQCELALESPYLDATDGLVPLDEVWLVTSFPLSEAAKGSIQKVLLKPRVIEVIDGPRLETLIDTFMPEARTEGLAPLAAYLGRLRLFCDSPEQFVVDQLHATFRLRDLFVPPVGTINVLTTPLGSGTDPLREDICNAVMYGTASCTYSWVLQCDSPIMVNDLRRSLNDLDNAMISARACGVGSALTAAVMAQVRLVSKACPFLEDTLTVCGERLRPGELARFLNEHSAHDLAVRTAGFAELSSQLQASSTSDNVLGPTTTSPPPHMGDTSAHDLLTLAHEAHSILYAQRASSVSTAASRITQVAEALRALDKAWERVVSQLRGSLQSHWDALASTFLASDQIRTPAEVDHLCALSVLTEWLTTYHFGKHHGLSSVKCDPLAVIGSANRLLLTGHLGAGKTTLIKQSAILAIESEKGVQASVPVFVSLASVPVSGEPLSSALLCSKAASGSPVLASARQRKWWLLDGLDESQDTTLASKISKWADGIESERIAVTSRPLSTSICFPGFVRLSLAGFDEVAIRLFISRFPWTLPTEAREFGLVVFGAQELTELASNPLLLTLMAVLAKRRGVHRLPRRRELLYDLIVRLLLGEWDDAKHLPRATSIPQDLELILVARASYRLYAQRKRYFTKAEFLEACEGQTRDLAEAMWAHLGLNCVVVSQPGSELFGFLHFSIQEYLAAVHLAGTIGYGSLITVLQQYADHGWWGEVLVFYAGIKRDITEVIRYLSAACVTATDERLARWELLFRRWREVADLTPMAGLRVPPECLALLTRAGWSGPGASPVDRPGEPRRSDG